MDLYIDVGGEMMKNRQIFKKSSVLLLLLCFLGLAGSLVCGDGFAGGIPVRAAGGVSCINDQADLLSNKEEKTLNKLLEKVSEKRDCDIVFYSAGDLGGKDAVAYIDDMMDDNDLGAARENGSVALLIFVDRDDPSNREVRISTDERANLYFSDDDNEDVIDAMVPALSDSRYGDAVGTYARECDRVFGQSLDKEDKKSRGVSPFWLFGDFGIGALLALMMGQRQKSKLKSVRKQHGAARYESNQGIDFSINENVFLDERTERRIIERDDRDSEQHQPGTTHVSSSGRKHGGAGRKF